MKVFTAQDFKDHADPKWKHKGLNAYFFRKLMADFAAQFPEEAVEFAKIADTYAEESPTPNPKPRLTGHDPGE